MADRRRAQATDESDEYALSAIDDELRRMLSVNSVVSTSFSLAERQAAAQDNPSITYTKIGAGACGAIFSQDGSTTIIKLAKASNSDDLWNDYRMHSIIATAMLQHGVKSIAIPACQGFVPKVADEFWRDNKAIIKAAEGAVQFPTDAIIAERIIPLPQPVRIRLIEKFCAPRGKEKALQDPANKDCLVRPYLGSLEGRSGGRFFSLRNFKLHLNQMLDLQLNVDSVAKDMGEALAVMRWAAMTDARDVEFVLGSSAQQVRVRSREPNLRNMAKPNIVIGPASHDVSDFTQRLTKLWLLDFNQIRSILANAAGVFQAVEAYKINDPYFPKPLQQNPVAKRLWNMFVSSYLGMSERILGSRDLPTMFVQGVIDMQNEKQARGGQK